MTTSPYTLIRIQEDAVAQRRLLSLGRVTVQATASRSEEASKINRAQLGAVAAATKSTALK
jgi:hypothetical protein